MVDLQRPKFSTFFEHKDDAYFFTGDILTVKIPTRYEAHNLLSYGDTIRTLCILIWKLINNINMVIIFQL